MKSSLKGGGRAGAGPPARRSAAQEARLAEALRENLKKRRAQKQARTAPAAAGFPKSAGDEPAD